MGEVRCISVLRQALKLPNHLALADVLRVDGLLLLLAQAQKALH
jgi:hypothetical protein